MTAAVKLEGVELHLAHPDELSVEWVGQSFVQEQLRAAWLVLEPGDLPLNPRILGPPGVGKTTLAYATGRAMGREVYIVQATMDTRPEDLLVTPVLGEDGKIRYVASGLVTAMLRGGVCVLDEGNRMTEKSWASLAPLLDGRRYVESLVAGIKIKAAPEFRFCATMNEDASTFEIPEYIHSRLQPRIRLEFPDRAEERAILAAHLPRAEGRALDYLADFLQRAHAVDEVFTVRDGINIGRFAMKLLAAQAEGKLGEIPAPRPPPTGPSLRSLKKGSGNRLENWLRTALEASGELLPGEVEPASPGAAAVLVGAGGKPAVSGKLPPPAPPDPLLRALDHAVRLVLGDEALRFTHAP